MARASYRRDSRGDLYLYLFGKVDEDKIEVYTYSPTLDRFNEQPSSRFTLEYKMLGVGSHSSSAALSGYAFSHAE